MSETPYVQRSLASNIIEQLVAGLVTSIIFVQVLHHVTDIEKEHTVIDITIYLILAIVIMSALQRVLSLFSSSSGIPSRSYFAVILYMIEIVLQYLQRLFGVVINPIIFSNINVNNTIFNIAEFMVILLVVFTVVVVLRRYDGIMQSDVDRVVKRMQNPASVFYIPPPPSAVSPGQHNV